VQIRDGVVLAGWLIGWWLLWRPPRLPRAFDDGSGLRQARAQACSVVIPARNEASSIGTLLASLARLRVAPGEVVVVDDGSDDDTAAIARSFPGVVVVDGEPLPDGWAGKPWACHQGAAASTGSRLVFLDADVEVADGALDALLDAHDTSGGLLSVQPYHRMRRAYERLSAPFNLVGMMGVGAASLRPARPPHGAFGPCLVTSRAAYEEVGGHRSVRAEVAEDVALARRYVDAGRPVEVRVGGDLISFRMYPDGVRQLIEGWSKNVATGAGSVPFGRLLCIGWWITCLLMTTKLLIEAVTARPGSSVPLAIVAAAAFAVQWAAMLRPLGAFGWATALLFPIPLAVFVAVFARSAYLTVVRRRVAWRGRSIPLRRRAADGAAAWR
jgi:4,4'-diaponeurosporenoate glycosyltransferase